VETPRKFITANKLFIIINYFLLFINLFIIYFLLIYYLLIYLFIYFLFIYYLCILYNVYIKIKEGNKKLLPDLKIGCTLNK
jgi:predicted membrane protein